MFAKWIKNLRRNWFLPVTALAFFGLMLTQDLNNVHSLLAAVGMFILAAMLCNQDLLALCRQAKPWCHILAGGTALYLCMQEFTSFYTYWKELEKTTALFTMLPFAVDQVKCFGIAVAAVGFIFVYLCTVLFWREITRIVREGGLLKNVWGGEWILYAALLLLSLLYVTVVFSRSEAFYGTPYSYDIIYTSDSPVLVKENSYLSLYQRENDLRQPLFAVFSAPFLAIPKLIACLLGASAAVEAMLLDYVQVAMLMAANFMLARVMDLDRGGRVCFMVLCSFTYTYLLFIVMMEQYIIAYFWLILCLYTICAERHSSSLALWGASGTLLSSIVLLPFTSQKKPWQNFSRWVTDLLRGGLTFVAVMIAFRRLDILLGFKAKLMYLAKNFGAGETISIKDRLLQYTAFCTEIFFAPTASANTSFTSWQQAPITQVQYIGVGILILAIIGIFLCRDKKISQLAAFWIALSLAVLVAFGWGTQENGLILYTLYFGWPYMVLLFQMAAKVAARLRSQKILYAFTALWAVAMAAVNIPAMKALVDFATMYYPA